MINLGLIIREEKELENLRKLIKKYPEFKLAVEYTDIDEGLKKLETNNIEVIILDTEFDINIITLAKKMIQEDNSKVLILLAKEGDLAVEAFEAGVLDYLIKPVLERRFQVTAERIKKTFNSFTYGGVVDRFVHKQILFQDVSRIPVWKEGYILLLKHQLILYCQVLNKKAMIYTKDDSYEYSGTLSELDEKLKGYNFFRCHKSYLVNIDHIKRIIPWFKQGYLIELEGAEKVEVPVSRHYSKGFKKMLNL